MASPNRRAVHSTATDSLFHSYGPASEKYLVVINVLYAYRKVCTHAACHQAAETVAMILTSSEEFQGSITWDFVSCLSYSAFCLQGMEKMMRQKRTQEMPPR